MTTSPSLTRIGCVVLVSLGSVSAQEAPVLSPSVETQPVPRPKPRSKPKLNPKLNTSSEPSPKPAADSVVPPEKVDSFPPVASRPVPDGPAVVCDAGKSVFYDGPGSFSFWVTRTGSVTIDNPLRPLTPDTTRVLQLVISDKLATAYGADLGNLRRGGSPAILEAQLGGPIRWDATLGTLPDALGIVADSGAMLAEMRFKECGDAPAAKTLPVAAKKNEKPATGARSEKPKPKPARAPPPAGQGSASVPSPATQPTGARLVPQGAIPE